MSGYIGTQPVPQATQTRQTFVATAAQTSFATAGYSVGYLDTFLNGVKLQDGVDYTATNGSDIVLTVGAALDDTLEVVAYTAFEVLDQTFTGTTTTDVLTTTGAFTSLGIDDNATSTAVTIDVGGNVGIGISPNADSRIHVYGADVNNKYIRTENNNGTSYFGTIGDGAAVVESNTYTKFTTGGSYTERMRIDDSGNVGIGTAAPTENLHISSGFPAIKLDNTDAGGHSWRIASGDTVSGFAGKLQVYNEDTATVAMMIDAAGRVTTPYQPSFRAYFPVSGVSSVNTTIIWSLTYHNTGNHFNTSTGVFTAPVAGIYAFTANTLIRYNAAAKYHRIEYAINGVRSTLNGESLENQAGPNYSSPSLSIFLQLSAGDTLSVHNGPTEVYGSGYGSFSGILIG